MAAFMNEEIVVMSTARDPVGDEEHQTILFTLLAMIVEDPWFHAGAPQEQVKAEDGRLLHVVRRLLSR
jgi:hypothetical protein